MPTSPFIDFTASHDTTVNQLIADTICDLQHDIQQIADSSNFSIYMGGGYGRGEGGVFITDDQRHLPYNDIDFFVFTRRKLSWKRKAFDDALQKIGLEYTHRLGISIDFAPAKNIDKFRKEQHTLMYQELLYRHVLIHGPDILSDITCLPPHDLPALEGLRLLVNRGMGLLLAIKKLADEPESPDTIDFAVRNMHKAAQGAGDALLMAMHRYDYSFERRLQLIQYDAKTNPAFKELAPLYKDALDFKIFPSSSHLNPLEMLPKYTGAWYEAAKHFVAITTERTPAILQTPSLLSDCIYQHPNFKGRGPFINAFRWMAKTKTFSPMQLLFKNPTTRLFSQVSQELFAIHEKIAIVNGKIGELFINDKQFDSLIRLWRIFN
ncbi:MAG: hypothetical protein K5787_03435 [Lentisphaeria bacterium]|nr:hypothetical protein [Lentisphaeria bacterium]